MTVAEWETYFKNLSIPKCIRINAWTNCTDVPKMIDTCLNRMKHYPDGRMREMCEFQLDELKAAFERDGIK